MTLACRCTRAWPRRDGACLLTESIAKEKKPAAKKTPELRAELLDSLGCEPEPGPEPGPESGGPSFDSVQAPGCSGRSSTRTHPNPNPNPNQVEALGRAGARAAALAPQRCHPSSGPLSALSALASWTGGVAIGSWGSQAEGMSG